MLITYLSLYLVFIMAVSIVVSLLVLKLKLPAPHIFIPSIIIIILLPAILGYFYVTYFTSIPEVVVPDVRGAQLEHALAELESLNLAGKHLGNVFDAQHPEGYVVSQRPEAGRMVKVGRRVSLLTSSGKRKVVVPNLLGRAADQAEAVLAAKNLFLGEVEKEFVSELDPGIILSQDPMPGEEVETGTRLSITVSDIEGLDSIGTEEGGFKLW